MTQSIPQPGQFPPPAAPAPHAPQHAAPAPEARPSIGSLVALVTSFLLGWTLHTIEVLLALVLPAWAASLIVVVLLLVIVLVLALAGKNAIQSAQKHRPDPAASVAATKEAIQKGLGK